MELVSTLPWLVPSVDRVWLNTIDKHFPYHSFHHFFTENWELVRNHRRLISTVDLTYCWQWFSCQWCSNEHGSDKTKLSLGLAGKRLEWWSSNDTVGRTNKDWHIVYQVKFWIKLPLRLQAMSFHSLSGLVSFSLSLLYLVRHRFGNSHVNIN